MALRGVVLVRSRGQSLCNPRLSRPGQLRQDEATRAMKTVAFPLPPHASLWEIPLHNGQTREARVGKYRRALRACLVGSLTVCCLVAFLAGASGAGAQGPNSSEPDSGSVTSRIVDRPISRWMSGPARRVLEFLNHEDQPQSNERTAAPAAAASPALALTPIGPNVRVNDPTGDGIGDADMTTQSEASLAVSGSNVVVGYNDSGRSSVFYKAADDLTGYSYSHDGGATWQDAALPNPYPGINIGDPVVAADPAGHFYMATLEIDVNHLNLAVAVARSNDGGTTFNTPKPVSIRTGISSSRRSFREIDADKPWLTVGRDPNDPAHSIVYASWTEYFFIYSHGHSRYGTRIVVSSSQDMGQTWSSPRSVVSQRFFNRRSKSVQLVSGSNLTVGTQGRLYVAWERMVDPKSRGTFSVREERIAHSRDLGRSFSTEKKLASPAPVGRISAPFLCSETMSFGPARLVRVQEFPVLGTGPAGAVYLAYNSGGGGSPRVRVARSVDRGRTWFKKTVASQGAFMPAIGADPSGVDVLFYKRTGGTQLKTAMARSADGFVYTKADVSSTTFGVPYTAPPFDPSTAPCYMGDYNGAYRTGGVTYAAWGDNRDTLVNAFWPDGRLDPNVYFTKG
jgi:hypothetical protein